MNWFGFNFNEPKNSHVLKTYLTKIKPITETPKNAKYVSGIVLDDFGLPLPGASIVIKGTNRGTTSDFDGNFSIEAVKGEILAVYYVGMKSEFVHIEKIKVMKLSWKQMQCWMK
ncbi:carboxypeptidase-like regulatory domain-containing protein [Flavobacterium piscinae]|uniref:carboxypeptidase-like regulatory domain-containing protein n=1 Tax=Flavobacterium piscinae TaxID=2506424 RepID=UPI001998B57D|nr:carboxypeptidase-like regulatory domain-containing protein [Flavobacterium piscinae]